MSTFKVETRIESEATVLIFTGILNEDFVQADFDIPNSKLVKFNLSELKSINSCGIRDLIKYLRRFPEDSSIEFHHCPAFFIQQVNMVGGFLNKMRSISSFYAPYIGIENEDEWSEFYETKLINLSEIPKTIERNGQTYEFDGSIEKFFRFLNFKY
jgi:hypothetical protein